MKRLCVIPARGGSKRIPRKNIRPFCGKPIIAYSIEAALASELFDEVLVSTDDEEIAEVSKSYGALVPFMRSRENANDHAGLAEVLLEVLGRSRDVGRAPEQVCCLLPTAPFITKHVLAEACSKLDSGVNDCVFTAVAYGYPIQRSLVMDGTFVRMRWPENITARSQDLEKSFHDAGQLYVISTESLVEQRRLFTTRAGCIVLDELLVQDIDTESDWALAELKFRLLGRS